MYVLFRCGVSRKQSEATAVLGESYSGIGVTDDYAAYKKHVYKTSTLLSSFNSQSDQTGVAKLGRNGVRRIS